MNKSIWAAMAASLIWLGAGCQPVAVQPGASAALLNPNQTEFTPEERAAWHTTLQWPDTCEDEETNRPEGGGLRFYSLDNTHYLLSVTCNAYAYQTSLLFMGVTYNPATKSATGTLLSPETYDSELKKVVPIFDEDYQAPVALGFDSFDDVTKNLHIFTKYRGVGDCGSLATYAVSPQALTLLSFAEQSCEVADEFHLKNPEAQDMPAWPIVYRHQ